MSETTLQIPALSRQAEFVPETIDEENRTVEVVASTGARVFRQRWFSEPFYEQLEISKKAIRLARIESGAAPVLDSHSMWRLDDVLGVVESARVVDGELRTVLRMSGRNERMLELWRGVVEGTIRNVSIIYRVHAFRELREKEGQYKVRLATDWEVMSVDFVPIGADAGAGSRGAPEQETNACALTVGERTQDPEAMTPKPTDAKPTDETRTEPTNADASTESTEQRTDPAASAAATATEVAAAAERTEPGLSAEAFQADQERRAAIRQACDLVGAERSVADELEAAVDGRGVPITVDRAREQLFERMAAGQVRIAGQHTATTRVEDESDKVRAAVVGALSHRVGATDELPEESRDFRGMSMLRLCEDLLERRGISTRGMPKLELARRALHSVADFPLILGDVAGKSLRRGFGAAPQGWRAVARRNDAVDFKTVNRPQLGEVTELTKLETDTSEIQYATVGEQNTTYALATFAKRMGYSRRMIINDDTSAFGRFPELLGNAARETETNLALQQITGPTAGSDGPTMGDGKALFHNDHNNKVTGAGTAPSIANLGKARAVMRKQTGVDGLQLNLIGRWVIVNADKELSVAQILSTELSPTNPINVNPFAGGGSMAIEGLISDARLDVDSPDEWYLAASPGQVDVLEFAYLEGSAGGPMVEAEKVWDRDGIEIRVLHDFAVAMMDWRGIVRVDGSA